MGVILNITRMPQPKGQKMKKLLIVDGNSIINRAYYGIRPLTTSTGLHTNAVFGTVNILTKHIDALKPDFCAIAYDLPEPTFRHQMYDGYKAGRRAMPDELAEQFDIAKEAAEVLGFTPLGTPGYEADDILGTLARMAEREGDIETYIVTGDRDSLQLIGGNTIVLLETNSGTVKYDTERFTAEYGVPPLAFVDVKALMGDSSDNIPGVPGIGKITALKLISENGSLGALYEKIDEIKLTPSLRDKLTGGRDSAVLSRSLSEINCDVPLDTEIKSLSAGGLDRTRARELFTRLEFSAFLKRFALDTDGEQIVDIPLTLEIDENGLVGIASREIVFDVAENGDIVMYDGCKVYKYTGDAVKLPGFFEGREIICHDCKRIYKHLELLGVCWRGCSYDVMLAAYVANSSDSGFELPRLAVEYLGSVISGEMPRAVYIWRLKNALVPLVRESGQERLLMEIEMPLAAVLCDMEMTGFRVDCEGIKKYGEQLDTAARELEGRIYFYAGGEFNINSPKQLGEILFDRLGLPHAKKTKTGYSTNAEVLEKLRSHEIVEEILDYRQVAKLKSTYVDGLLKVADSSSRIHTTFKQTGTATGRISSTEPNLQNIPVRTELGRELRRFFIPENSEYVLIDADYSQIELRLLANISGDENMVSAFLAGADIHTSTAAAVFDVPADEVTAELRKRAKAVNFGIIYGIGEFSLSKDLDISVAAAKRYIQSYLAKYPKIDEYLKKTIKKAYENGYVTTLLGRRRYITELKAQNHNLRSFGERVAMNSPIQGSAADIIKIAMVNVSRRLRESGIDARLILQVHDELIIESHRDCADTAHDILRREMEEAIELTVPLSVDIHTGNSWFDCK